MVKYPGRNRVNIVFNYLILDLLPQQKFIIPGKSETEDAYNAIAFHEYFVEEYQKIINKSLISDDRSFCAKIKNKTK